MFVQTVSPFTIMLDTLQLYVPWEKIARKTGRRDKRPIAAAKRAKIPCMETPCPIRHFLDEILKLAKIMGTTHAAGSWRTIFELNVAR
jgi:hypothetical protein